MPQQGELFYMDDDGLRKDEKLHEAIIAAGDQTAAQAVSRKVAKELGLTDEEITALFSDFSPLR